VESVKLLREGFRIAGRHKRLIFVLWLVPLVPALVLGAMAASNLAPTLGQSLFSDRALDGDWFVVLMEFRSSPADALDHILIRGVVMMALLTLLFQVALSAGVVEVLLEGEGRHPFVLGVRKNFPRFFRTTLLLSLATVVLGVACRFLVKGLFKLAEAQADGRLDIVGVGLAVVVFIMLWAPLDLAADLSRISAAHHDHRKMIRGFFRGWWTVIRRPGLFIPLYLTFLLLPMLMHFVYYHLRSPWTPATAVAILALLVMQQLTMLVRAYLKLGFWGAELAAFRALDEPEWCRPKVVKERTAEPLSSSFSNHRPEVDPIQ
jgi:hypothetical protein